MKIVWEPCIYGGNVRIPCVICGEAAIPTRLPNQQVVLAVVYNDQGRIHGEACRSCVSLTPEGIRERLQDRILSLQAKLQDLQDLNQGEIELPTLEQELRVYLE